MDGETGQSGTAVFVPSIGRYLIAEFRGFVLTICVLAVAAYFSGSLDLRWVVSIGGGLLIGSVLGAAFQRKSRRLAIGDTWISGPTGGSSEPTTITLSTLDAPNSGFRRGVFVVQALGGGRIKTKMYWYSPTDAEEIRRLARVRCGISPQPE